MNDRREKVRMWQEHLESAFAATPFLEDLENAESLHAQKMAAQMNGFCTLINNYQEFALQTVAEAKTHDIVLNVFNVALNVAAFKRMRSCLHAFRSGLYNDAASGLRTVLEITSYLAAVLHGEFWFDYIWDFAHHQDPTRMSIRELRKLRANSARRLAQIVKRRIYGPDSGLSPNERELIEVLDYTNNAHVHYGESNITNYVWDMARLSQFPSLYPTCDLESASMFCNTAVLVAWMHVRILPYLSTPQRFSEEWTERYDVLESSLRGYIESWDKPAGQAFISLVEQSFTFDSAVAEHQVLRTAVEYVGA